MQLFRGIYSIAMNTIPSAGKYVWNSMLEYAGALPDHLTARNDVIMKELDEYVDYGVR